MKLNRKKWKALPHLLIAQKKIKLSETIVQKVTTLQTYLLLPKIRNDMQLEEQWVPSQVVIELHVPLVVFMSGG